MTSDAPWKFIATGLVGPDDRYWLTTDHRPRLSRYEIVDGKKRYMGMVKVAGYYCQIRPYPDQVDEDIARIGKPKLLTP